MKEIHRGRSRDHIYCSVNLKIWQNVWLEGVRILVTLEHELDHQVKLRKYIVDTLKATIYAQLINFLVNRATN